MADTAKASWITDHPFQPRTKPVDIEVLPGAPFKWFPPNPWLCQLCRMAEAAHKNTSLNLNRESEAPHGTSPSP